MANEESENEFSMEITPIKSKISITKECVEPSSTSTLPAMTQDFVEYGEADYGVDLTTFFHKSPRTNQSTQTGHTPTVTSPSPTSKELNDSKKTKKKKNRCNSMTVENEVNGIFDLLNSSDEMSQNEILTQPIHNAESKRSVSKPISKHSNNKKNLDHLVSGLKYRKRRRQRQELQLKTKTSNEINRNQSSSTSSTSSNRRNVKKGDLPKRQRLRLTSYFQTQTQNKTNNDISYLYESSITSDKNRSLNQHTNDNNYRNKNDQKYDENDHDGIFGSILKSIRKDIQDDTTPSLDKSSASITPLHPQTTNNNSTNTKSSNISQTNTHTTAPIKDQTCSKDSTKHTTITNIKASNVSQTNNELKEINPANHISLLPSQMYDQTHCDESIKHTTQKNVSKKQSWTNEKNILNTLQQSTANQTPIQTNINNMTSVNISTPIHSKAHTAKPLFPLTDPSHKVMSKNTKSHPHINPSHVTNKSKDIKKSNTTKKDDSFDDIEFDEKALLIMDNLVKSGKTPKIKNQALRISNSIENNISSNMNIKSDSNLLHKPMGLEKKTTTITSNNNKQDDDSFGSIPDIDFEEMDKLIAQRTSLSSATESSSMVDNQYVNPPCSKLPICNKRMNHEINDHGKTNLEHASFSRYIVVDVIDDNKSYTKTIVVSQTFAIDDEISSKKQFMECSSIHLRGEWYRLILQPGNIVHLVSISGQWRTDFSALPVTLHTLYPFGSVEDDLVLVLNPHMLMTPSITSEAVECPRRAVIKSRLGSSGLNSYAAVIGTMRHELFEKCLQESNFSFEAARLHAKTIVRKHANLLLGCEKYDDKEACAHLLRIIPEIQRFAKTYINFGEGNQSRGSTLEGNGFQHDIWLRADSLQATEESVITPELGLKGNIDATLKVTTRSSQLKSQTDLSGLTNQAILGVELKTGHNQNTQNAHLAQLALYSIMLRVCHGSSANNQTKDDNEVGALHGGMLLYLNHESHRASYTSSTVGETKSLIIHRNLLTVDIIESAKPRGIVQYEENTGESSDQENRYDKEMRIEVLPAPAPVLPEVLSSNHQCNRCYVNKECMMYAKTLMIDDIEHSPFDNDPKISHALLLQHYTGHLSAEEIKYFRDWDRLIDLEAAETKHDVSKKWLKPAVQVERSTGKCISGLEVDESFFDIYEDNQQVTSYSLILCRKATSNLSTPLSDLKFDIGCQAVVSVDSTIFLQQKRSSSTFFHRSSKHERFHILRGTVEKITDENVFIRSSKEECRKIVQIVLKNKRHQIHANKIENANKYVDKEGLKPVKFRLDRDDMPYGVGTLRQNLMNLFLKDIPPFSKQDKKQIENKDIMLVKQRVSWLRKVIVNLSPPLESNREIQKSMFSFPGSEEKRCKTINGCDFMDLVMEYSALNSDQRSAVEKVISSEDYSLIQGLPGTGKTSTIAFVTRLLVARGKRVLLTSYTHAAVDNLMIKLLESGVGKASVEGDADMIRIGNKSQCHPLIHELIVTNVAVKKERWTSMTESKRSNSNTTIDCNANAKSLREVITNARIVGCSALTVPRSPLLAGESFDVVIVDEAGQISQPAILGVLLTANSFVLVGDHMQLPPLVVSKAAEQAGYGVSMLKRLADKYPASVAQLKLQYRMNQNICSLCNDIVYKGALTCGDQVTATNILKLSNFPSGVPHLRDEVTSDNILSKHWLFRVIQPSSTVLFLDTDGVNENTDYPAEDMKSSTTLQQSLPNLEEKLCGKGRGGTLVNHVEKALISLLLYGFSRCGMKMDEIGILSPYNSQVQIMEEDKILIEAKRNGLEFSTIDRFQGKDKSLIILSLVRSNAKGKAGMLLNDFRRLNVAVSRAKQKLIMIGSASTLHKGSSDVLRPLLEKIQSRGWIEKLPKNAHNLYELDKFHDWSLTKRYTYEKMNCKYNNNEKGIIIMEEEEEENILSSDPNKKSHFYLAGSNKRVHVSSQELKNVEKLFKD